jgi:hypothetical protein
MVATLGACLGSTTLLHWAALADPAVAAVPPRPWAHLRQALPGGVFALHWLVILPAALVRIAVRRGPTVYDPTQDRIL